MPLQNAPFSGTFAMRLLALLVVFCFGLASPARASSGWFTLKCEEAKLGDPQEVANDQPPQYHVKLAQGETLTLVAQGVVSPRGGKLEPFEPDAGAWLFDDTAFALETHEKKKYDATMLPIKLRALKSGKTRIRFVGNVLGYDRKYDVLVEVVEKK
jgi:hypothetical protein